MTSGGRPVKRIDRTMFLSMERLSVPRKVGAGIKNTVLFVAVSPMTKSVYRVKALANINKLFSTQKSTYHQTRSSLILELRFHVGCMDIPATVCYDRIIHYRIVIDAEFLTKGETTVGADWIPRLNDDARLVQIAAVLLRSVGQLLSDSHSQTTSARMTGDVNRFDVFGVEFAEDIFYIRLFNSILIRKFVIKLCVEHQSHERVIRRK
mmetsp:Transcript_27638/g.31555  ORF Transcript_27638/g.31555 Transcript_27638/m.31555 type:complete len:208 (+) Transcript_27638:268-891(+)